MAMTNGPFHMYEAGDICVVNDGRTYKRFRVLESKKQCKGCYFWKGDRCKLLLLCTLQHYLVFTEIREGGV